MAGNDPLARGYESHEQWRERFDRARSANFVLYGDSESSRRQLLGADRGLRGSIR